MMQSRSYDGETGLLSEVRPDRNGTLDSRNVVVAHPPDAPWIGVLRHSLGQLGVSVVSSASLDACRSAVRGRTDCLLLLEITPEETSERLELVQELCDTEPRTRVIVLIGIIDREIERMLREIGVCEVIQHASQYNRIIQIARSHARRASASQPTPTHSSSESP